MKRRSFAVLLGSLIIAGVFLLRDSRVEARPVARSIAPIAAAAPDTTRQTWSVGIFSGPSPFELSEPAGISNPVLTDRAVNDLKVNLVAHPFMLVTDSMYYMYFTSKDGSTDKGGIGLAESRNGLGWKYRRTAIHEPFVLAYPYVFEWQGEYYMTPEAHTETAVRLYKATAFPDGWTYVGDLLIGDTYISPTIFRYKDTWWMYVCRDGNESLRLFYATNLMGPWTEHPKSPIVEKNLDTARPAGRPFVIDGTLYRLGQDCDPTYGYQVHAFKVTEISPTAYSETMIEKPIVKATGKGWNGDACHHVDLHRLADGKWIACVDGQGTIDR